MDKRFSREFRGSAVFSMLCMTMIIHALLFFYFMIHIRKKPVGFGGINKEL